MKTNSLINSKEIGKKVRRFHKVFARYRQKLLHYYGFEAAKQVEDDTFIFYKQLIPETPKFEGKINVFNFIMSENVLLVAFYKAMKKSGKDVHETVRILYEIIYEVHSAIPGPFRWVMRKFFFSPIFLQLMRHSAAAVSTQPMGWRIEYRKGDGISSDWYFECSKCAVINFYKSHDTIELARYCNFVDYIQSLILGLGMVNQNNIGQGDLICCEYMKEGRTTAVPNNLSEILEYQLTEKKDSGN